MEKQTLKWFDYIACVWFADNITVGLLSGNIFVLTFGILSYILYENWRKGEDEWD
jgi:hypothetical protein